MKSQQEKKKPPKTPTKQQHILHHNIIFVKCMCNLKKKHQKKQKTTTKNRITLLCISLVFGIVYTVYTANEFYTSLKESTEVTYTDFRTKTCTPC